MPQVKSFLEYFYHWEQTTPQAIYLRQPKGSTWTDYSWAEVGQIARTMASALQQMGLPPGSHIGIVSKNCCHWVMADLAIMLGGYVSVPFYPNLTGPQLAQVIDHSDIKVLFVGKLENWTDMREGVPDGLDIIRFPHYEGNSQVAEGKDWHELLQSRQPLAGNPLPDLHQLWTILYTSGTTGTPKGVMHSFYTASALLENERQHNNLKLFEGEHNRFFSYLPMNHIAERVIVEIASFFTGASISFGENIDTFASNLQATQPTLFLAVPRIWTKFQMAILDRLPQKRLSLLLKLPLLSGLLKRKIAKGLGLSKARILLTGAAPTPQSLSAWYTSLGLQLQEVYGMTENCGGCTLMRKESIRTGTVGQPVPNCTIRIDPETQEVQTQAPWTMLGYYKDPDKTEQVLKDGWLHSADLGALDANGFLKITGRLNDVFKTAKGKYVVPGPIEWELAKNTALEQICVVGLGIGQPLALVVLSEVGKSLPEAALGNTLEATLTTVNNQLARFQKVAAMIIVADRWEVDTGILTPTMKVKRNVIDQRYSHLYTNWFNAEQPIIYAEPLAKQP